MISGTLAILTAGARGRGRHWLRSVRGRTESLVQTIRKRAESERS